MKRFLLLLTAGAVIIAADMPAADTAAKPPPAKEQQAAFLEAAGAGHLAKIQELLAADARLVNAEAEEDGFPQTALSRAMRNPQKQTRTYTVTLLLKAGADPNAKYGENADTPLLQAVREHDMECFNALLEHGADFTAKNALGESALILTRRLKDKTMFETLKNAAKKPEFQKREKLRRAAFAAVQKNDLEQLKKCIDEGFSIRTRRDDGETVLSLAAAAGSAELVKFALAQGVPADGADMLGLTPLMHAVKNAHPEIAELLIAAKADPLLHDRYGMTALMHAAAQTEAAASGKMAKMLLAAGANVDQTDKYGSTALMYAVRCGNVETIRILLDGKADKTILDRSGLPAAKMTRDPKILELLK